VRPVRDRLASKVRADRSAGVSAMERGATALRQSVNTYLAALAGRQEGKWRGVDALRKYSMSTGALSEQQGSASPGLASRSRNFL
jgi:hypothetical protein